MRIEVIYALPDEQLTLVVEPRARCTAGEAIRLAGLENHWRPAELPARPLACFGRLISADTVLSDGDRVEILRGLLADPKDLRRQRAETARRNRRGLARVQR